LTALRRGSRAACIAALLGALLCGPAGAATPPPANGDPAETGPAPAPSGDVAARWARHEVKLAYQGLTTRYSCEGFKEKLGALLRYFGARPESIRLRAHGCAGGPYRPSPAINLDAEFETLAPSPPGDASKAVPARWVERDLFAETRVSRDAPSHIERGDCELVQKFVSAVLPSFTHEVLQNLTRCIPNQLGGSVPNLRVRVLVAEPPTTLRSGS
jgi:hypothetical protein